MRRSAGEWAGLVALLIGAGGTVAFGVAVVGSFLNLPSAMIAVLAVVAFAAIAVPLFRTPARPTEEATGTVEGPGAGSGASRPTEGSR